MQHTQKPRENMSTYCGGSISPSANANTNVNAASGLILVPIGANVIGLTELPIPKQEHTHKKPSHFYLQTHGILA